jgi:hypothetical protein
MTKVKTTVKDPREITTAGLRALPEGEATEATEVGTEEEKTDLRDITMKALQEIPMEEAGTEEGVVLVSTMMTQTQEIPLEEVLLLLFTIQAQEEVERPVEGTETTLTFDMETRAMTECFHL